MIDVAEVADALVLQLTNHVETRDFKNIQRSETVNVDESITPWVGVYQDRVEFDAHTLGRGAQNWLAKVHIDVIVQAHGDGGADSEDKLGDALQRTLNAIISDLTIGGTVEMITSFNVQRAYVPSEKVKTMDFQHAIIGIIAEVRA